MAQLNKLNLYSLNINQIVESNIEWIKIDFLIKLKDTDFIIKREDLYITAKIWNTFHRRERVIQNLKMSLNEMKLAYVDLTLIHFPLALKEGDEPFPLDQNHILIPDSMKTDQYLDTWKGLEDALDQGLTKSIGVSNFNVTQLSKLVNNSRIKPVVNQVSFLDIVNTL